MKACLLLSVTVALFRVALPQYNVVFLPSGMTDLMWDEYKNYHGKDYSDEEDAERKQHFTNNLNNVFNHNMMYHSNQVSYRLGMNEHSDMSHDDFVSTMTGYNSELDCKNSSLLYKPPANAKIPESVDWNAKGYVTKVLNQGKCGACWAFCSIASLEGQHKRKTGKLIKMSEQQLIDCSNSTGNKGCGGGQMCRALEYATDVNGVNREKDYPFVQEAGQCKFAPDKIASTVGGYLQLPVGDEDTLKKACGLLGPIAAGVDGSLQSFRHYKTGIFDDDQCSDTLSHAVTIIGYGTENGKDFWLVKNSWGPSWGQDGIGKMVRNKNNHCGISSKALFPVLDKDENGKPKLDGPAAS